MTTEFDRRDEELAGIIFEARENYGKLKGMKMQVLRNLLMEHEEKTIGMYESRSDWASHTGHGWCICRATPSYICHPYGYLYDRIKNAKELTRFRYIKNVLLSSPGDGMAEGRPGNYTLDEEIFFYEKYGLELPEGQLKLYLKKMDRLKRFAGNINFKFN